MEFLTLPGYLLAKAFKHAIAIIADEKNLRSKQIAAMAGLDEPTMSKLKSGKQGIEAHHLEKIEAIFPGFIQEIESYLKNRGAENLDNQEATKAKTTEEVRFLKSQLQLWQMMYFRDTNMSEKERDDFIKKIFGG